MKGLKPKKVFTLEEIKEIQKKEDFYELEYNYGDSDGIIEQKLGIKQRFLVVGTEEEKETLQRQLNEELVKETAFETKIRNTEKKEVFDAEIYLEYNDALDEINITIHDLRGTTEEYFSDVKISCSGNETEDEIKQYLIDFWEENNFPFEFFSVPELPAEMLLGKQEYIVYLMKKRGDTYKEIAQALKIAESTARGQYRNALQKIASAKTGKKELSKVLTDYYFNGWEVKTEELEQIAKEHNTTIEEIRKILKAVMKIDNKTATVELGELISFLIDKYLNIEKETGKKPDIDLFEYLKFALYNRDLNIFDEKTFSLVKYVANKKGVSDKLGYYLTE